MHYYRSRTNPVQGVSEAILRSLRVDTIIKKKQYPFYLSVPGWNFVLVVSKSGYRLFAYKYANKLVREEAQKSSRVSPTPLRASPALAPS